MRYDLATSRYKLTPEEKKVALMPLFIGAAWLTGGLICWLILYTEHGYYYWFMFGAFCFYFSQYPLRAGIAFWRSMNDE